MPSSTALIHSAEGRKKFKRARCSRYAMSRYFIYLALICAGLLGITLSMPLQSPAVIFLGLAGVFVGVKGLKVEGPKVESRKSEGQSVSPGGDEKNHTNYSLLATSYLAILATCYFITRAYFSPVADLGMEDLMLILPAGLLYFIAGYRVRGKSGAKLRQGLAWVVILLLLCHLTSSVYQLQGEEGFSLARYFTSTVRSSEGSVTGMYGYYGSFANFAVIAGMLCLSLGVWGRMKISLRACLFLLGLVALGLAVWSQSRSAALSLVVALAVFGVLLAVSLSAQREKVKHRGRVLLLVLGVAGLALSVAGGMWVFGERSGSASGADVVFASAARTLYWSMATEQWVDYPLVGAGSRSFSYESFRYWSPNMPSSASNPEFVHNEYLQLLADYGLVGLLLILGLLGFHLYLGGKQLRELSDKVGEDGWARGSNAMALTIAGMCGIVAMSVHITLDFRTHLLGNLLLLVCCAAWVLPVAKSGSWEVKGQKVGGSEGRKVIFVLLPPLLSFLLIILGFGAVCLGSYQLWGGMPLLENKIAKEDGGWDATKVDRHRWILTLEESVKRAPSYERWLRLGSLYRLEAHSKSGDNKAELIEKAKNAYLASIERNEFNPIPRINLAAINAARDEFVQADKWYASASEMAKAREKWFKMHLNWGALHQRWALNLWKDGQLDLAADHLKSSMDLYEISQQNWGGAIYDQDWASGSIHSGLYYGRLLDTQQKFEESDKVFENLRKRRGWHWMMKATQGESILAQHLNDKGMYVWSKRKPEEAYQLMLLAKHAQLIQKSRNGNFLSEEAQTQLRKIQEVIDFLEKTGIR